MLCCMVYKQAVPGKSERKLVSSLAFSIFLSFLDRSSMHTFSFRLNTAAGIGNARIAGLKDSPFTSAGRFNLNLIASLQPVVTTFHQLLLLGVALGIIEAAWSWR